MEVNFIFHSHCIALNQDTLMELDLKRLNSSAPSRCSTLPQGTDLVHQQRVTASDLQVLTLVLTTSHPAGTHSGTQITVQ